MSKKFEKIDFERVRKYIERGYKDATIMAKTGWSSETLRLARKYENWSSYRSYMVRKRKKAEKRREELKVQLANERNDKQLEILKAKRGGKADDLKPNMTPKELAEVRKRVKANALNNTKAFDPFFDEPELKPRNNPAENTVDKYYRLASDHAVVLIGGIILLIVIITIIR